MVLHERREGREGLPAARAPIVVAPVLPPAPAVLSKQLLVIDELPPVAPRVVVGDLPRPRPARTARTVARLEVQRRVRRGLVVSAAAGTLHRPFSMGLHVLVPIILGFKLPPALVTLIDGVLNLLDALATPRPTLSFRPLAI